MGSTKFIKYYEQVLLGLFICTENTIANMWIKTRAGNSALVDFCELVVILFRLKALNWNLTNT